MRILVLGGTVFLGRHIVEAAVAQGHQVTLFNRGRSDPDLFPDLEKIIGDRTLNLDRLKAGKWDTVIDTSGYAHAHVRSSAVFLKGRTPHYTFVSTASVYREWQAPDQAEDAPLVEPAPHETVVTPSTFGPMKLACEYAVREQFPDGFLIVRPVLIVGPRDPTDRFTYWPMRIARGGEILAPMPMDRRVQVIDARDLAAWIVKVATKATRGFFNACGLGITMQSLLDLCAQAAGVTPDFTWVSEEFLKRQNVAPYQDLPLWFPDAHDSFLGARALTRGLVSRPLERTVKDIFAAASARNAPLRAGLSAEREASLLALWHAEQGARV